MEHPFEPIRIPAGAGAFIVEPRGSGVAVRSEGLKSECPYCGTAECAWSCDESQAGGFAEDPDDDTRLLSNAAIDGVESLLLALYSEGVDLADPRIVRAVQTATDAIGNQHG